MCFSGRVRGLAFVICLSLTACACARRAEQRYERLAVLPFENLTGDPALDWAGRAAAIALAAQLNGSSHLKVTSVPALRNLAASGATQALEGYIVIIGGRLVAKIVLADAASGRALTSISASDALEKGPLPVADAIARAIDRQARPFGTRQPAAMRAYVEALSPDATDEAARAAFERAIAADPDFGEAHVSWVEWLLAHGDRAGAGWALASARERYGRLGELPRARLEVVSQLLEGPYSSRRDAMVALSRLTPADGSVFRSLGDLDTTTRRFPTAIEWYKQALEREPDNPLLLNELGYAQAYNGDLNGAVKSLRRYQELRPADANALDSLGDVHYLLGRFREAERFYLEAHSKAPGFGGGAGELEKAAQARLMTGDVKAAGDTFGRYLDARRGMRDPLLEYRQAQWEILAGNLPQAAARLEKLAASPHPAAWLGLVQLCAMSLDAGDRERARQYAARALASRTPRAALCGFLAQASARPAEWAARAQKAFPEPPQGNLKRMGLALGLLLDRHFDEAVPLLEEIVRESPPSSPEPVGVYLAWALVESGRAAEARNALALMPLPRSNAEQPFAVPALRRLRELRARAGKGG